MPPTAQIFDCRQFAQSVTSAGGTLPETLAALLRSHEVLTAPVVTEDPGNAILDAAAAGALDQKLLAKLLGPAALAASAGQYRAELAGRAERMLVMRWYRELKAGAADAILDSLRPAFNEHAEQIAKAKSVGINSESTLEHLVASATSESGLIEAWNALDGHIRAITRIASVASQFGFQPQATFPQVKGFTSGHVHLIDDRALLATSGGLLADSALFRRPDAGHRTSPFFRTTLRLQSISEAQHRHDLWAADEFDRINADRDPGGWIDQQTGEMHPHPRPVNPYREVAKA
jgi:hypothetical protein